MEDLLNLIQLLYKKYFNNTDPMVILEKTKTGKKIEMSYIDNIVMLSIKKHIPSYELLSLLGDKRIQDKINKLNNLLDRYINSEISDNKNKILNTFIKDYQVNTNDIDLMTLKLVNNYMKN